MAEIMPIRRKTLVNLIDLFSKSKIIITRFMFFILPSLSSHYCISLYFPLYILDESPCKEKLILMLWVPYTCILNIYLNNVTFLLFPVRLAKSKVGFNLITIISVQIKFNHCIPSVLLTE